MHGEAVLANAERDKNLIQWAEGEGLAVRIDRSSIYGNPYVLDKGRDEVCELFEKRYLFYKKSILARLPELKGKVLVCHCYPDRCHGEALIIPRSLLSLISIIRTMRAHYYNSKAICCKSELVMTEVLGLKPDHVTVLA